MATLRRRRILFRYRLVSVPLIVAAIVFSAITATAYFLATGAGIGSGSTGSLQPVTVVAFSGDTPDSTLLPGGTATDVIVRLSNPNAYSVTLVSVTGSGPITADNGHPGCATTGVTFAGQTGLQITVPSGSSLVHLPGAASMSTASSNGCQGAIFSIPVHVTVHTR